MGDQRTENAPESGVARDLDYLGRFGPVTVTNGGGPDLDPHDPQAFVARVNDPSPQQALAWTVSVSVTFPGGLDTRIVETDSDLTTACTHIRMKLERVVGAWLSH